MKRLECSSPHLNALQGENHGFACTCKSFGGRGGWALDGQMDVSGCSVIDQLHLKSCCRSCTET